MSHVPRWLPPTSVSPAEAALIARLGRVRKLFRFLREHRHEIFDDAFQTELESMYRSNGAGRKPLPPAMLCMVTLLQAYMQVSDAEAVELTVVDRRWQLVLDCLDNDKPLFSQGALPSFRARLIANAMDRRLFEKTIEVARRTGAFDPSALSRLRLAVDSAPFEGAGRVEDTFNLLAHAARNLLGLCCFWLDRTRAELAEHLDLRLLTSTSVKAGMDIDWSNDGAKAAGLAEVYVEVQRVVRFARDSGVPELGVESACSAKVVEQIIEQNLDVGEQVVIRRGVAKGRRITVEDAHMRHGRKSASSRVDGYKRHLAVDLDSMLVLHCGVSPANRHDSEHMEAVRAAMERGGWELKEIHIDRGYLPASFVDELYGCGTEIVAKPWTGRRAGRFGKADFHYDLRARTVRCPAGQVASWRPGRTTTFERTTCERCPLRDRCTTATASGRTLTMAANEPMHEKLRRRLRSPAGRRQLRERVAVEHAQAHLVARQGPRSRYVGLRKNLMDVRRCAAIQNLHTCLRHLDRQQDDAELQAA